MLCWCPTGALQKEKNDKRNKQKRSAKMCKLIKESITQNKWLIMVEEWFYGWQEIVFGVHREIKEFVNYWDKE